MSEESELEGLKIENESLREQHGELVELVAEKEAKLEMARTYLRELINAHEARGKIQAGWKYNAQSIVDQL